MKKEGIRKNNLPTSDSHLGGLESKRNLGGNRKKILLIVVGILLTLGIVVGVSYAWWTHTISQEGINTIQSTCLEIELADENPITLQNAYPITDLEASLLTPYTFTIRNKCNTTLEYDVNLDIMESKDSEGIDNRLSSSYVAIEFNGGEKKLLNTIEEVETSYPGEDYTPVEGRYLVSGELEPNESKSYSLKLWMDEHVTIEDNAMNKNFISKVAVTAKQSHKVRLADMVKLGDYIEMTPTSTSYTIPKSITGYSADQTINPSELNLWRVIKINDDGTVDMVSEYTSSTIVNFYGMSGYQNFVNGLQTIAKQYENEKYTASSRCFGFKSQSLIVSQPTVSICGSNPDETKEASGCGDIQYQTDFNLVKEILGSAVANRVGTETPSNYWLASRLYAKNDGASNGVRGQGRHVSSSGILPVYEYGLWEGYVALHPTKPPHDTGNYTNGNYYRPIVTLKPVSYQSGIGTKENPYQLITNE